MDTFINESGTSGVDAVVIGDEMGFPGDPGGGEVKPLDTAKANGPLFRVRRKGDM